MAPEWGKLAGRRPHMAGWAAYLAAGPVVLVVYYAAAHLGPATEFVQTAMYCGASLAAVVALGVGHRLHSTTYRLPWMLLMLGQLLSTGADVTAFAIYSVAGDWPTSPHFTDGMYLGTYPLMVTALVLLVRRRTPGWDSATFIDAAIVAVSAAFLFWIFLVTPMAGLPGQTAVGRLVSAAYPVMDLLLLIVGVRLMLGAGTRTPAFRFLCGYLVLLLTADTIYGVQNLLGIYQPGNFLDGLWISAVFALGAAALHPSMARLTDRSAVAAPDATVGRLILLALASLIAPITLQVQHLREADLNISLVVAACVIIFLLVLLRMAGLVRTQRLAAITDGLTGLRTRRFFEEALTREVDNARRHRRSLGVLLLDIDHFKRVNDTYGHHGGDRVLCEVSRRMREVVRTGDLVARYGGEEFAVLLPDIDPDQATKLANRVLDAIGGLPIAVNDNTLATVTTSIGIACLPQHCDTGAELTQIADRALYTAKEGGRNQAVSARNVGVSDRQPAPAAELFGSSPSVSRSFTEQ